MEAERVLLAIGGPWRLYQYILLCFTKFIQAWAMFGNVFLGTQTRHHCHIPDGYNITVSIPHHMIEGKLLPDKCLVYKNFSYFTNETEPCPNGWTYGPEMHSTVDSWDLVCERDHLPAMSQTVLVGGVLCGAFITTIFADRYGRKSVLIFSMVAIAVIGCITAAVDNYYVFTTLRFFTGVFQQGVVLPSFVLVCELFPSNKRALWAIIYNGVFWAIGSCFLVLFAYYIPHWRHLLLAISLPGLIGILYIWLLTESPAWLMAKLRYKEVKALMKQSLKWDRKLTGEEQGIVKELISDLQSIEMMNKNSLLTDNFIVDDSDKSLKDADKNSAEESANYTIFDIFKSRKLVMFCMINMYLWCTTTLVYYGLSFSSGSLTKSKYLGFILSALPEIPACITCAFTSQYIGRRYPIVIFYTLSGIGVLVTLAVPKTTASGTDLSAVIIIATMVGKFGISATFNCIFLWSPEMYPTTVRNIGVGLASVAGRVGNICAPLSAYAATNSPQLIGALFGGLSLGAAGLSLILPETHGRILPLTISEVEKWSRTVSKEEKEAFMRKKEEEKAKYKMISRNANDYEASVNCGDSCNESKA